MNSVKLATLAVALIGLTGCSYKDAPEWKAQKKRKVYQIATRQLPPQPVYNPLRWVRPPQVTPSRRTEASTAPLIMPVINFQVKNLPLKEAILVFAAPTGYRVYCSSLVADRKITLDTLGTMDELAKEIAWLAGIKVVVDHHNREVRFLGDSYVAPSFKEDETKL